MHGRTIATLAAASLLVLAGCSFGGNGSPTATEPANATGTPTATETPAGQAGTYPAGYDESGVANATVAESIHRTALLATTGFAVSYEATVTTPNATTRVRFDQETEPERREMLRRTNITSGDLRGEVARYYANDTVHVKSRQSGAGETTYSNESESYSPGAATGVGFVRPALADVRYGESERTIRDGTEVVVYDDATLDRAGGLFGERIAVENVTEFSATLVVDADGIVRELTYSATVMNDGRERSVAVTVAVSDIGETTVERPAWVDRA